MFILIYDTETNKMVQWGKRSAHPTQPHIVQLAAALYDSETRQALASLNFIIKPEGWEITEETVDIHGITEEHATAVGIPEGVALAAFISLWERTELRVAHGASFDKRVIAIALSRFGDPSFVEKWKDGQDYCTMQSSRKICGLRDKAGRKNKPPKLAEAYRHFTGKEMTDAHKAHGDVRACALVYWMLQAQEEGEDEK